MRSKPCVDPAHLGSPADLSHDVSEVCARLSAALSGDFVQAGTHEFSDPMGARLAGFVQRLIVAGQHASAQARERELELRLAHRVARIGTWRRDLRTNVLSWSDELHVLFGTDPAIFKPTPEGALLKVHPDDRSLVTAAYARVRQNGGSMEYEFRTVGDDGTIYWRVTELHAERDESGACVALRGVVQDVTERKRTLDQIQHLAHFDALTGLVNRSQLGEQLRRQLTVATRRGQKVAIHAVDLDGFKGVNDLHGHAAGDRLLQKLAGRLLQNVREGDTVARLGGDEFIIVQTEAEGAEDARRLADRIVSVLGAPCDLGGVSAAVTASIGIALFPDDVAPGNVEDAATGLLAAADTALCRVKQSPRNGHAFFQPGLDGQQRERRALEQDLRLALARGELSLAYQPQADAGTGKVLGFEALLRWHQPERGIVSPAVFIPVAEATGLIVAIGAWVLRQACIEAACWVVPLRIAVNVSALQIQQDDLPRLVQESLRESGLHPSRLELEVTESVLLADHMTSRDSRPNHVLTSLHRVRAMGVRLAMDDFGTGYSSLASLRAFPFDKIKLDRGFVADLGRNDGADAIIRAVLGLGRGMNLPVIAEGVETTQQADALRKEGCNELQGYLIGRPLPISSYATHTAPSVLHALSSSSSAA